MGKRALIIEAGGARNAFTSGVLVGMDISPDQFDAIFAVSSGFGCAVYYAGGQMHQTRELWSEQLSDRKIMSPLNPLFRRPFLDVKYLVEEACANLDEEAVVNCGAELFAVVLEYATGQPRYLQVNTENIRELFKATCSIPPFSPAYSCDETEYVDGGIYDPLPVKKAYELGFRELVVLRNRPMSHKETHSRIAQMLLRKEVLRERMEQRRQLYEETLIFLLNPPSDADIHMIAPDGALCHRFNRRKTRLDQIFDQGVAKGQMFQQPA